MITSNRSQVLFHDHWLGMPDGISVISPCRIWLTKDRPSRVCRRACTGDRLNISTLPGAPSRLIRPGGSPIVSCAKPPGTSIACRAVGLPTPWFSRSANHWSRWLGVESAILLFMSILPEGHSQYKAGVLNGNLKDFRVLLHAQHNAIPPYASFKFLLLTAPQ